MGRAWGPWLQIAFGPEQRPARKEEAAELFVVGGGGVPLQRKLDQLLCAKTTTTTTKPSKNLAKQTFLRTSLEPDSLQDAEVEKDATAY